MLSDTIIVQSAVSAFNNAALWAPAFLWWALLALPMFVVTYMCSETIMARLGWTRENILERMTMWTTGLIFAWVVLFGGNYSVLRDGLSVLPMMTAAIVFLTSLFVTSHLRRGVLVRHFGWRNILMGGVVVAAVGMSDMHAWWGPLLQIGAMMTGCLLGWFARGAMRPIAGMLLIMTMVVVAMLMQPEFFRFGQLGNLTIFHLMAMLLFGILGAATIVLFNVAPRGAIKRTVYIKLKWLLRVVCALGGALFLLTEAVPVFLGALGALVLLFALSVGHSDKVDVMLGHKVLAAVMVMFGIITVMPVISAMGILYWQNVKVSDFWPEIRRLL
ncbi:MAG: hypothetical protein J6K82_03145 [Alphaproteobacteria bacterium]|nr:hypothetical protein [Alphaproteobacteria bacterium]